MIEMFTFACLMINYKLASYGIPWCIQLASKLIRVPESVYEKIRKLSNELGASTLSETIEKLIAFYESFKSYAKIKEIFSLLQELQNIINKIDNAWYIIANAESTKKDKQRISVFDYMKK
jgi:hypothetical protein